MPDKINFNKKINDSVQVGDILYYSTSPAVDPEEIGPITEVGSNFVVVDDASNVSNSDFISFRKSQRNISSIKGYYMQVEMRTDETQKVELFSVGSEITESSK
tara:strand:- start:2148 stop:2456 length:309 start_codon:yes stop_codon:yes gene_type:complete